MSRGLLIFLFYYALNSKGRHPINFDKRQNKIDPHRKKSRKDAHKKSAAQVRLEENGSSSHAENARAQHASHAEVSARQTSIRQTEL